VSLNTLTQGPFVCTEYFRRTVPPLTRMEEYFVNPILTDRE